MCSFAVDEGHVYFVTSGSDLALQRHAKPIGMTETVAADWPGNAGGPMSIVPVGEYVYGLFDGCGTRTPSGHLGYLVRAKKDGGCTEWLMPLPSNGFELPQGARDKLYWVDTRHDDAVNGHIAALPLK